ncbi:ATP-binding cassette sub-family A member 6 [Nycticebus coucang]|uniref:ATP-binding cassette sub-family A member 6 n=1 Tax=Nycticebus coucang TaxID=9470 RepID=UPI00234D0038|nr:ATP-binding cassette sub-family A member 6 [Nycticebus coucang]XP_053426834.1 ATP-binding cassette sub-family A member 6 [Nycticebus coucang]XP_053426835.1 ATP-binding cassette sub-family A member 6 [Nycticebus coucang]XP_053426836.1 ATP-binding cassette sub-family A member 6 [Nycticebus coucang]XP_053426837.1 ATP-binding cassette sub-family A member 6 [Nycticebus coucang]
MGMKQKSVFQQMQALLHKNFLKKWRMKRESSLEWGLSILLGVFLGMFSNFLKSAQFPEIPPFDLGRVDKFNSSSRMVVYTPISNVTQEIMNKTAFSLLLKERSVIGVPNEKHMDKILEENFYAAGIIFNDIFSYKLKFLQGYEIPFVIEEYHSVPCWQGYEGFHCMLNLYWTRGFTTLQTAINAAIIEITTNHSVMENLMSVTAETMKTLPFISRDIIQNELFILYCLLYFSPLTYFLSLNVTKERKKYKDLMKVMGLQDSAFWFSWGLIYAGFFFIISIVLTVIITSMQIIVMTGFMVMFILFFLYGLSLIALVFLMSVLLKKAVLTNLVVFLLTLFWGCLGFPELYKQLPSSLKWIFSICSPFAFTAGMTKVIQMDYNMNGEIFPDPSGASYTMIATFFVLALDGLIYFILTLYFDKNLSYGSECRCTPLFFLNSSSCFHHQRTDNKVIEKEVDPEHPSDDYFEPVAPEFRGKEAIRIRNVKKEYKGKSGKVEALKGLLFDIYEDQITAILGHSGAGKTSLLNILNGLSVPTEGSITIYNKNLSETQDLKEIRKITGICPQFNIQFDVLTVKENLSLFAKIKGIPPQEVEQEVQRILLELDIQNIQDKVAEHLSEGQKRKLTFGIAILGDPQVLLLDEPTTGLDPFSRHQVWSLLKERRANRVILFSTQFMDEADILADRKVIMSNGRLKCAGSSIFLKRKWGLGYHLSLYRNETCDPEQITSLINRHVPEAKLKTESKESLVYTLPLERTNTFPDLFSDLDKYSAQGVMGYDVSTSTMDEVFMKLEGKSTIKQDFEQVEMSRDSESLNEMEQIHSSHPETQKAAKGMGLWRMQVCAVARLRFLKLKRERKVFLTLLLVFGIAAFPLIVEYIIFAMFNEKFDWEFKTGLYFLSPGQLPQEPRTSLLIINNTESNIEDFIQSLKHQSILLEVDDFANRNVTEGFSYNGAIIVSGKQKDYNFSVVCNTKRMHCFPILMNIISNGLLRMFNHTQYIQIERSPYPFASATYWSGLPEGSIFLFLVLCSTSPYIAMSSISDYKKKTKSQLWISGLYTSAYWCGQALVDTAFLILLLLLMYFVFYMENMANVYATTRIVWAMVIITPGYAASLVFLTYMISFIFQKRKTNSGLLSFCFYIVSSLMLSVVLTNDFGLGVIISTMVLVPSFTLFGFLTFMQERAHEHYMKYQESNFDLSEVDLLVCLIPYFQALLFIFVLRCMELKCGKKRMRKDPVFRLSPQSREARPNPEEPVDEDEDVHAERIRTATALTTSNLDETSVIIASCLHKEYAGQKKNCFSKRKKKLATRNISFCVEKGEILGLLGPNGAGKSSSIRMISGITKPTAGEVELKGCNSISSHQGEGPVKFLGYCPQENVLWPMLTMREHLEVYATVKGLRKGDAKVAITRLVDAFKLHEQLNVPVQKLTAGATRKLCFVLSILGNSPVLLLDEPSTGMDPTGQWQMWQAIRAAVKHTESSVILITHYLAEAEALCDRVAIMVSGRLRCIGSIQHLKNKFGKDYILELKVKEPSQVTLVHTEILKLFPQAVQRERYSSLLTYKLCLADVYPLSQAFHKLETAKCNFNLEEYSLSQCTLEKVFLELSKEQEEENFDEDVDTTMRWKLLPHSDEP